jgi:hypothetical protein
VLAVLLHCVVQQLAWPAVYADQHVLGALGVCLTQGFSKPSVMHGLLHTAIACKVPSSGLCFTLILRVSYFWRLSTALAACNGSHDLHENPQGLVVGLSSY